MVFYKNYVALNSRIYELMGFGKTNKNEINFVSNSFISEQFIYYRLINHKITPNKPLTPNELFSDAIPTKNL